MAEIRFEMRVTGFNRMSRGAVARAAYLPASPRAWYGAARQTPFVAARSIDALHARPLGTHPTGQSGKLDIHQGFDVKKPQNSLKQGGFLTHVAPQQTFP
jgi:hypothetical protein